VQLIVWSPSNLLVTYGCVCQANLSDTIVTDTGVSYLVTDRGQMMSDHMDTEQVDTTPTDVADTLTANDGTDSNAAPVDVSSILVSAEFIMDVKKKYVCAHFLQLDFVSFF